MIDGDHGRWPLLQRAEQQKVVRNALSRGLWGKVDTELIIVHNVGKIIEEDVIVYVHWLYSCDWCPFWNGTKHAMLYTVDKHLDPFDVIYANLKLPMLFVYFSIHLYLTVFLVGQSSVFSHLSRYCPA